MSRINTADINKLVGKIDRKHSQVGEPICESLSGELCKNILCTSFYFQKQNNKRPCLRVTKILNRYIVNATWRGRPWARFKNNDVCVDSILHYQMVRRSCMPHYIRFCV